MENKNEMMEQLQLELIIAKENNDEELYQILVLIQENFKKELEANEDQ